MIARGRHDFHSFPLQVTTMFVPQASGLTLAF